MHTRKSLLPLTGALLTASSQASAHGGDHVTSSLYHYLASPHHVASFTVLALAALSAGLYITRHRLRARRLQTD